MATGRTEYRLIHLLFSCIFGPVITLIAFMLVFASGFTGLVYEVLWLKELGYLFGSTTHAAATTLAVFFLGLAAGGWWWGSRSGRMSNPLRTYAGLEVGIAASASLYFLLLPVYHSIYGTLFGWFGDSRHMFLVVKFVLAAGILFLPSFFMGGTLPVIAQYLVKRRENLGKTGTLLYGINTVGAALGAFVAGFILPRWLGFSRSYLTGITISVLIAGCAYLLSRTKGATSLSEPWRPVEDEPSRARPHMRGAWIWVMAFVSGFVVLSLEVLWTRMFAQVLQNSVYSFAAILVVILVSLAAGSAIAHILIRLRIRPSVALWCILTLAGIGVAATPHWFYHITNSLKYLMSEGDWISHMRKVFGKVTVIIMIPGVLIGILFPYLLKVSEKTSAGAGRTIGHLSAVNTFAGILGATCAGFLLISWCGLWTSIVLMAAAYLMLAVVVVEDNTAKSLFFRFVPMGLLILATTMWNPTRIPLVTLTTARPYLYGLWEGSYGVVSVVGSADNLIMNLDNKYPLGDLEGMKHERMQAYLPLRISPRTRSVFFIGLGTGITAGAALSHPVERVVICELIPEVEIAAKKHFAPYVNGLFDDERVHIVSEDGRNYLKGTRDKYDVIISDLFIPFNAGTGSLYTKEHFVSVKSRLNDDGLFALWLPMFMLSKDEFSIITKTMLAVFPQVTLWRGNFLSGHHIVALIGQPGSDPLDPGIVSGQKRGISGDLFLERQLLRFYAGNMTAAKSMFRDARVNTDDRPLIEYLAPITNADREASGKKERCLNGKRMLDFYEELLATVPPREDPYLARLTKKDTDFVRAGLALHRSRWRLYGR